MKRNIVHLYLSDKEFRAFYHVKEMLGHSTNSSEAERVVNKCHYLMQAVDEGYSIRAVNEEGKEKEYVFLFL